MVKSIVEKKHLPLNLIWRVNGAKGADTSQNLYQTRKVCSLKTVQDRNTNCPRNCILSFLFCILLRSTGERPYSSSTHVSRTKQEEGAVLMSSAFLLMRRAPLIKTP